MATASRRPKRTPVGVRNVLTAPKRDGYVRRWVNDEDDRIDVFKAAGYEPVKEKIRAGDTKAGDDSPVGSVVTKGVGNGMKAVLMEIPEDYYREDQQLKEQQIKAGEQAIHEKIDEINQRSGNRFDGLKMQ